MGATTVLATAPAHAPARASLAAVLDVRFSILGSTIGGGASSLPCGGVGDNDDVDGASGGCSGDAAFMIVLCSVDVRLRAACFAFCGSDQKVRERRVSKERFLIFPLKKNAVIVNDHMLHDM